MALTLTCIGDSPATLAGYHNDRYYHNLMDTIEASVKLIQDQYPEDIDLALSRGLQGVEMLFDAVIDEMRKYERSWASLSRESYIPFPNIDLNWAVGGMFGQTAFREGMKAADTVHFVNPVAPKEPSDVKGHMKRTNRTLLDPTDVLLLVTKDNPAETQVTSATWLCKEAIKRNKDVWWIAPQSKTIYRINQDMEIDNPMSVVEYLPE